ncbi:UbiH/UbiF/VisC/COQ6 family ubiquinone biosynthesis hydroxylase [Jannaschia aquimarina]|uniref:UbiF protein n=1 Tax=Jannaschia aquimarina TaxID=935700 RepID=A0A0D1EIG1_9RHOB|nr:UbiH/UbiF/VisC/COQ6 family ubiquinone biosynthesis hydroxylase [Jannaschia aquimarina]KIT16706.1 2-octaprenyl-3-methyl-6-methoxy-1,4-benzoquinol hydroxylase [Jannaschia aquimarina]SNS54586.1 2-octaprenyl-6-methoxyphenol hydroxylase /2-octaprenyl-3-methyl-6-methoxy-1,4-benzoquinol hydroxylase [Jannaschia aquimarina]
MDTDVIIVGGGLSGPLTALALARGGMSSVVLDAAPRPDLPGPFTGRAYAIALAGVRMLQALDLWETIEDAQPITGIRASDGRVGEGASSLHLRFDAAMIGERSMGHMVEDRHLRHALLQACVADPCVEVRFDKQVVAQDVDARATVTLADGGTLSAALLVGCDGRGSGVAERAGLRRNVKDYRQTALTCAVAHARPHDGVAHQLFLPPGPLAILPLADNRSSLVWTETAETAAQIAAMDEDAYLDILRPRFGSFLGEIELTGARGTYPLTLTLTQDLIAPRVALAGDAGHGIHPIAGQGLNLGIKDVAALAEVLTEARRRGEDIGSLPVLERYARWRRFDNAQMGVATDAVNALFSNDDPILRGLRRLGLGAVDHLDGLKRRFIREAAGLSGDLPRLLQGQPL